MVGVNAMFGMPWLVAATVRSLSHLHALAEKTKDGKFVSVLETRLTNLFVHTMILISLFILPVLKLIPVPVLYGVFLYMGLTSLSTNQFWLRTNMFLMQPSRYPSLCFTERVEHKRMHMFTAIQLFLFATLYAIKSVKTIAIAFPIIIAICIPIRLFLLPKIFTKDELLFLDGDPGKINKRLAALIAEENLEGAELHKKKMEEHNMQAEQHKKEIDEEHTTQVDEEQPQANVTSD